MKRTASTTAGVTAHKNQKTHTPPAKKKCLICQFSGINTAKLQPQFLCHAVMSKYVSGNEHLSGVGYRHIKLANVGKGLEPGEQQKCQKSFLMHLSSSAKQAMKSNTNTKYYIGKVHYAEEVRPSFNGGRQSWQTTIEAKLASKIRSKYDLSYNAISDTNQTGHYFVVPNIPMSMIKAEYDDSRLVKSPSSSSSSSSGAASSRPKNKKRKNASGSASWCKNQPQAAEARISLLEQSLEDKTAEIEKLQSVVAQHVATMKKQEEHIKQLQEEKEKQLKKFDIEMQKRGGLSRYTLTSDLYHKLNPGVAHELFGFKNWKTTKRYLHCLFSKQKIGKPPKRKYLNQNKPITNYEKCLIALMRMHCQ